MNILSYVDKYKDFSLVEEPFNDVDNLIFSALTYIDFRNILPTNRHKMSLEEAGTIFINWYENSNIKYKDIVKLDNIKLLKKIYKTKRYKDALLYNYLNINSNNMQFCAMTIKTGTNTIVAFEGTDETLVGWKEDFKMAYTFPVDAQVYAINYLNKTIKLFDRNIIVLGHSKGGNLALTSSMYCNSIVRCRIKKVYSNDGPGIRRSEFESNNYKKILNRYIHIVPDYSYIGVLLRNTKENDVIVKSLKKGVYAHHMFNWEIQDKNLKLSNLSKFSSNLQNSNIIWLDNHDDEKRKKMIDTIFNVLEESNIKTTYDFKNIKVATTIIKNMTKIDEETRNLALDFFKFNINYQIENRN